MKVAGASSAGRAAVPSVSVVVPLFNKADCLSACLCSVREQSRSPLETIVVDDGSTDGSSALLQHMAGDIRAVHQQNAGASAARTRGIALAKADFVAFLDADDHWLPDKLQDQMDFLGRHPHIDWCASNWKVMVSGKQERIAQTDVEPGWTIFDDWFAAHEQRDRMLTSGVVVRRALLEQAGGFDESIRYGQDSELWVRLALMQPRFGFCGTPLFEYHDVPDSVSTPTHRRSACNARIVKAYLVQSARLQHDGYRRYARRKLEELLRRTLAHGHVDIARNLLGTLPPGTLDRRLRMHALLARLPAPLGRGLATARRSMLRRTDQG